MLISWLFLIVLSAAAQFGETPSFSLLETERPNIRFVNYSIAQRKLVANAAINVLQIWLNIGAKQKFHDIKFDPVEKAKQIASDAESLSDDELHKELSTLFMSLRDGHTLYKFPGPHSCYSVTQAISFSLALDINDTKIIVSEFNKNQQVLDMSPNATKIALGDQVLQIDSMSIDEYYAKNKFMIGGANSDASKRAMLTFMAVRDGALSMMPMENTVTYLLQSRQSGEKYSVSLPWVSSKLGSCYDAWINGNPTMSKSRGLFDDKPKFKMQDTLLSKDVDDKMSLFSNNFVGDLNPFGIDFQDTLDPLLKYGIWKPGEDNIGVLQLKSFYPSSKDAVALTSQIRDLLMRQLKDTNGLLIDVRDNPGGLINLADYIPQLFGSNIESVKGNFKVNSINNALVKNTFSKSDIWFNSYYKRKWFSKFSSPVEFTSKRYVNYVGQAYIKPVAVLVNARCFSSCDIFAANMKDNGVALVFGEDESTGGGGANVVGYNNFLNEKGSETFPRMPFSNLPSAQDITVAWRQVSRVKKSLGKLIEDYGVEVDQVVKPRTLDFVDGKSNSQYDYIAKKLLQVGIETKRNQMYFNLAPTYELNAVVGDTVSIAFTCQGIQRVEIVDAESNSILITKSMNTTKAEKSKSKIQFNARSNPGYKKIILNAYDDNLKLVFSTARMIRYTPQQRLQLLANETRQLDWVSNYTVEYLTDIRPYAELQQTKWTRSSTVLGIDGYSDYANTRITWFLNVENLSSIELEVDVSYATELDADYLRISYTSMFGTQQLLGSYTQINGLFVDGISGNGRLTRKFTLSDLDSVTEISIEFISDENTVGKGVFVHKMQLKT